MPVIMASTMATAAHCCLPPSEAWPDGSSSWDGYQCDVCMFVKPHHSDVLQGPTRELCPLCMLPSLGTEQDISWNEDEVYRFLVHFYQGSSPQAGLDVTGAAAGYQDGGYAGR